MDIILIGKESKNRLKMLKNLNKAINGSKIKPIISESEEYLKKFNITSTPALVINQRIVSEGKILNDKEIKKFIKLLSPLGWIYFK